MRRYLLITAVVIVALGIGVTLYFWLFSGSGVTVAPAGTGGLPVGGHQGTTLNGSQLPPVGGSPTAVTARLVKISAGPVVPGEAVVNIKPATASSSPETLVSYIERKSGNVFSYAVRAKTLTRTSNRTVPGIEMAAWLPNASHAFVRYLSGADFSTVNTYALPQNGTGGFFLSQNLSGMAVSSTSILTLASGVNGSTASLARTDGSRSTTVFTTPLSSLRLSFAGKTQYLAFTKPSASLPGHAFIVDEGGHFSRIAGPLTGLVALASPSGKFVLISYTQGTTMQMSLVTVATGESTVLPIATIADKCVWTVDDTAVYCGIPRDPSSAYRYPDDWYQGAVSFSDRIWKISVAGRFAQLILDFSSDADTTLDATSLSLDPLGTTLVFVNKVDGSLWSYTL